MSHPGTILHPETAPRWKRYRLAFTLCLLVGLCACGQKGPLYLPQPEPDAEPNEASRFVTP